jgi:hypothetical protein
MIPARQSYKQPVARKFVFVAEMSSTSKSKDIDPLQAKANSSYAVYQPDPPDISKQHLGSRESGRNTLLLPLAL